MKHFWKNYIDQLNNTLPQLNETKIEALYHLINHARLTGNQVFILGNGGSAACSSHWVCDFTKGASVENEKRIKMIAPSDNTATLTAYGNDVSYESVLLEQIKNFLTPNDVVISMSVSGSSPNLLAAHRYAQSIGCTCACIIGAYNGTLKQHSDLIIEIPSTNYGIVEDIHLILGHVLSQHIKRTLSE